MGSIVWAIPAVEMAPYLASKSAIVGLTRTLAHELGVYGIRVNSIMPGQVFTERQAREINTPEWRKLVLERQALKRELLPDEISRVALWLIADDSSGITSQSIVADGGWI
jgi:NAD(P)-dependent dehydrogenase (short-subunit alcohol dehydrogenase family)